MHMYFRNELGEGALYRANQIVNFNEENSHAGHSIYLSGNLNLNMAGTYMLVPARA